MQQKKTTKEEYQKCVNVVVEYINQHLGEEIDLKSLAKVSNFSPFYFHRIMKAFLGEPIGTFIVRTRTEAAARLLRYSDIPIADIAYRIGYSSPSSLSKVFRQFYGISPLEYRNNKNFVIMKPAIIRPELELKSEIKNVPARNVIYIRLSGDYKLNDYGGTWTVVAVCQRTKPANRGFQPALHLSRRPQSDTCREVAYRCMHGNACSGSA